ncbi:hypothetical protein BESB_061200 [Besnoitia besnoiti]|uniref:Uncharacterized protein n=1 Tax=Besnoitia besnoiti TaxID=94643 RepID=A0A2A9MHW0_BESBE|nr:hypothetical protein BESB_061200 [Besnoitia besnoiti]PFH35233.1 hypothetical protein BESB_061200 [Besnoitia besnoiti]
MASPGGPTLLTTACRRIPSATLSDSLSVSASLGQSDGAARPAGTRASQRAARTPLLLTEPAKGAPAEAPMSPTAALRHSVHMPLEVSSPGRHFFHSSSGPAPETANGPPLSGSPLASPQGLVAIRVDRPGPSSHDGQKTPRLRASLGLPRIVAGASTSLVDSLSFSSSLCSTVPPASPTLAELPLFQRLLAETEEEHRKRRQQKQLAHGQDSKHGPVIQSRGGAGAEPLQTHAAASAGSSDPGTSGADTSASLRTLIWSAAEKVSLSPASLRALDSLDDDALSSASNPQEDSSLSSDRTSFWSSLCHPPRPFSQGSTTGSSAGASATEVGGKSRGGLAAKLPEKDRCCSVRIQIRPATSGSRDAYSRGSPDASHWEENAEASRSYRSAASRSRFAAGAREVRLTLGSSLGLGVRGKRDGEFSETSFHVDSEPMDEARPRLAHRVYTHRKRVEEWASHEEARLLLEQTSASLSQSSSPRRPVPGAGNRSSSASSLASPRPELENGNCDFFPGGETAAWSRRGNASSHYYSRGALTPQGAGSSPFLGQAQPGGRAPEAGRGPGEEPDLRASPTVSGLWRGASSDFQDSSSCRLRLSGDAIRGRASLSPSQRLAVSSPFNQDREFAAEMLLRISRLSGDGAASQGRLSASYPRDQVGRFEDEPMLCGGMLSPQAKEDAPPGNEGRDGDAPLSVSALCSSDPFSASLSRLGGTGAHLRASSCVDLPCSRALSALDSHLDNWSSFQDVPQSRGLESAARAARSRTAAPLPPRSAAPSVGRMGESGDCAAIRDSHLDAWASIQVHPRATREALPSPSHQRPSAQLRRGPSPSSAVASLKSLPAPEVEASPPSTPGSAHRPPREASSPSQDDRLAAAGRAAWQGSARVSFSGLQRAEQVPRAVPQQTLSGGVGGLGASAQELASAAPAGFSGRNAFPGAAEDGAAAGAGVPGAPEPSTEAPASESKQAFLVLSSGYQPAEKIFLLPRQLEELRLEQKAIQQRQELRRAQQARQAQKILEIERQQLALKALMSRVRQTIAAAEETRPPGVLQATRDAGQAESGELEQPRESRGICDSCGLRRRKRGAESEASASREPRQAFALVEQMDSEESRGVTKLKQEAAPAALSGGSVGGRGATAEKGEHGRSPTHDKLLTRQQKLDSISHTRREEDAEGRGEKQAWMQGERLESRKEGTAGQAKGAQISAAACTWAQSRASHTGLAEASSSVVSAPSVGRASTSSPAPSIFQLGPGPLPASPPPSPRGERRHSRREGGRPETCGRASGGLGVESDRRAVHLDPRARTQVDSTPDLCREASSDLPREPLSARRGGCAAGAGRFRPLGSLGFSSLRSSAPSAGGGVAAGLAGPVALSSASAEKAASEHAALVALTTHLLASSLSQGSPPSSLASSLSPLAFSLLSSMRPAAPQQLSALLQPLLWGQQSLRAAQAEENRLAAVGAEVSGEESEKQERGSARAHPDQGRRQRLRGASADAAASFALLSSLASASAAPAAFDARALDALWSGPSLCGDRFASRALPTTQKGRGAHEGTGHEEGPAARVDFAQTRTWEGDATDDGERREPCWDGQQPLTLSALGLSTSPKSSPRRRAKEREKRLLEAPRRRPEETRRRPGSAERRQPAGGVEGRAEKRRGDGAADSEARGTEGEACRETAKSTRAMRSPPLLEVLVECLKASAKRAASRAGSGLEGTAASSRVGRGGKHLGAEGDALAQLLPLVLLLGEEALRAEAEEVEDREGRAKDRRERERLEESRLRLASTLRESSAQPESSSRCRGAEVPTRRRRAGSAKASQGEALLGETEGRSSRRRERRRRDGESPGGSPASPRRRQAQARPCPGRECHESAAESRDAAVSQAENLRSEERFTHSRREAAEARAAAREGEPLGAKREEAARKPRQGGGVEALDGDRSEWGEREERRPVTKRRAERLAEEPRAKELAVPAESATGPRELTAQRGGREASQERRRAEGGETKRHEEGLRATRWGDRADLLVLPEEDRRVRRARDLAALSSSAEDRDAWPRAEDEELAFSKTQRRARSATRSERRKGRARSRQKHPSPVPGDSRVEGNAPEWTVPAVRTLERASRKQRAASRAPRASVRRESAKNRPQLSPSEREAEETSVAFGPLRFSRSWSVEEAHPRSPRGELARHLIPDQPVESVAQAEKKMTERLRAPSPGSPLRGGLRFSAAEASEPAPPARGVSTARTRSGCAKKSKQKEGRVGTDEDKRALLTLLESIQLFVDKETAKRSKKKEASARRARDRRAPSLDAKTKTGGMERLFASGRNAEATLSAFDSSETQETLHAWPRGEAAELSFLPRAARLREERLVVRDDAEAERQAKAPRRLKSSQLYGHEDELWPRSLSRSTADLFAADRARESRRKFISGARDAALEDSFFAQGGKVRSLLVETSEEDAALDRDAQVEAVRGAHAPGESAAAKAAAWVREDWTESERRVEDFLRAHVRQRAAERPAFLPVKSRGGGLFDELQPLAGGAGFFVAEKNSPAKVRESREAQEGSRLSLEKKAHAAALSSSRVAREARERSPSRGAAGARAGSASARQSGKGSGGDRLKSHRLRKQEAVESREGRSLQFDAVADENFEFGGEALFPPGSRSSAADRRNSAGGVSVYFTPLSTSAASFPRPTARGAISGAQTLRLRSKKSPRLVAGAAESARASPVEYRVDTRERLNDQKRESLAEADNRFLQQSRRLPSAIQPPSLATSVAALGQSQSDAAAVQRCLSYLRRLEAASRKYLVRAQQSPPESSSEGVPSPSAGRRSAKASTDKEGAKRDVSRPRRSGRETRGGEALAAHSLFNDEAKASRDKTQSGRKAESPSEDRSWSFEEARVFASEAKASKFRGLDKEWGMDKGGRPRSAGGDELKHFGFDRIYDDEGRRKSDSDADAEMKFQLSSSSWSFPYVGLQSRAHAEGD